MSDHPALGKVDAEFFERVIASKLGATRSDILVGPQMGLDNGIIDLGNDQVMAVTTDPISYIPELGAKDSAWISVHLVLSDFVSSGLKPAYAILNLNLPPELESADFGVYWETLHEELTKYGVAVVSGHTGRYEGCGYTIVGSCALLGIGHKDSYITPAMAEPGNALILTKGAMSGTAGLLARIFPNKIEKSLGIDFLKSAQGLFCQYSTVEDAYAALSVGVRDQGVTAMHDATEGGIEGAAFEMASAAICGLTLDLDKIPVCAEAKGICELFDLDPFRSLSEGALLIAANAEYVNQVIDALRREEIESAVIGEFKEGHEGITATEDGKSVPVEQAKGDPYWEAYQRAKKLGWT